MSVVTRVHVVPAAGLRTVFRQVAVAALLCSAVAVPAAVSVPAGASAGIVAGEQDNTWPVQPTSMTLAASLGGEDNTWPTQPVASGSGDGTDNTWPVQPAA